MAETGSGRLVVETSGQGGRAQLPALTGLRFLAALLVLVGHAGMMAFQFSGPNRLFLFWTASACLGMSLFFLLSGFVIHYNYAQLFQKETPARALYAFLSNRIARLYPLFLFVMLVNQSLVAMGPHLGAYKYLLPQYLTLSPELALRRHGRRPAVADGLLSHELVDQRRVFLLPALSAGGAADHPAGSARRRPFGLAASGRCWPGFWPCLPATPSSGVCIRPVPSPTIWSACSP